MQLKYAQENLTPS